MNDPEMERKFVEMSYQEEPTLIRCEVEKALKEIIQRKAVGVDDLQIELLKEAGEEAIENMGNKNVASRVKDKKLLWRDRMV